MKLGKSCLKQVGICRIGEHMPEEWKCDGNVRPKVPSFEETFIHFNEFDEPFIIIAERLPSNHAPDDVDETKVKKCVDIHGRVATGLRISLDLIHEVTELFTHHGLQRALSPKPKVPQGTDGKATDRFPHFAIAEENPCKYGTIIMLLNYPEMGNLFSYPIPL